MKVVTSCSGLDMRWLNKLVLIVALLMGHISPKSVVASEDTNFKILGIIASSGKQAGVALIKETGSGKTFAARVGTTFSKKTTLRAVNRRTVEIVINEKVYIMRVGDESSTAQVAFASFQSAPLNPNAFEREGDTVKVAASLRDHIVNQRLGEVLMQAAAVPYVAEGRLAGFTLWDIEPQSVFELAGLKNGDTITSINGQEINDVGLTIRLLHSLKNEPNASLVLLREGKKQNLNLSFK